MNIVCESFGFSVEGRCETLAFMTPAGVSAQIFRDLHKSPPEIDVTTRITTRKLRGFPHLHSRRHNNKAYPFLELANSFCEACEGVEKEIGDIGREAGTGTPMESFRNPQVHGISTAKNLVVRLFSPRKNEYSTAAVET